MGSYYYLMAQLPHLGFDQKPPMSSQAFRELSASLINENDAAFLNKLSLDFESDEIPSGCKFIDSWREWERALRLNLSKNRAAVLHRESSGATEPPFVPQDAVSAAHKAVGSELNPMEGEIAIDRARWNAIDELAGTDYFSRNSAYAYLLKLLLLERHESFNVEKGFSEYKSLYAQIMEHSSKENAHNPIGEQV